MNDIIFEIANNIKKNTDIVGTMIDDREHLLSDIFENTSRLSKMSCKKGSILFDIFMLLLQFRKNIFLRTTDTNVVFNGKGLKSLFRDTIVNGINIEIEDHIISITPAGPPIILLEDDSELTIMPGMISICQTVYFKEDNDNGREVNMKLIGSIHIDKKNKSVLIVPGSDIRLLDSQGNTSGVLDIINAEHRGKIKDDLLKSLEIRLAETKTDIPTTYVPNIDLQADISKVYVTDHIIFGARTLPKRFAKGTVCDRVPLGFDRCIRIPKEHVDRFISSLISNIGGVYNGIAWGVSLRSTSYSNDAVEVEAISSYYDEYDICLSLADVEIFIVVIIKYHGAILNLDSPVTWPWKITFSLYLKRIHVDIETAADLIPSVRKKIKKVRDDITSGIDMQIQQYKQVSYNFEYKNDSIKAAKATFSSLGLELYTSSNIVEH